MKFSLRNILPAAAIALFALLAAAAIAQSSSSVPAAASPEVSLRRLDQPGTPPDEATSTENDSEEESVPAAKPSIRTHRSSHQGDDQVVVLGDNHVLATQKVTGSAVAVAGNLLVDGAVSGDAVAVLGSNTVNGSVKGSVVAVLGDLTLGPKAEVGGDAVCVGGMVHRDPGAVVGGNVVNNIGTHHHFFRVMSPLKEIFIGGPFSRWAWIANILILAFYAVVALVFPGGIRRVGSTLLERPGMSILASFLAILCLPVLFVLLLVTIIGIPIALILLPVCVVVLMMFGKASFYALVGRLVSRDRLHPSIAVLVGGLICLVFFIIPIAGLLLSLTLSLLMMGCGIVALLSAARKPATPAPVPTAPPPSAAPLAAPASPVAAAVPVEPPPLAPAAPAVAAVPEPAAASLERAGFWIRTAALAIDGVLLAIIICPIASQLYLPALAAYAAIMWKIRGSTIGGIVCGLKVVRLDDRALDWPTAIVRALGCFLSLFALCLGFVWVAFDRERQSWHDKIAGTVVVRPLKRVSLV